MLENDVLRVVFGYQNQHATRNTIHSNTLTHSVYLQYHL